jgi:hypothetical protein
MNLEDITIGMLVRINKDAIVNWKEDGVPDVAYEIAHVIGLSHNHHQVIPVIKQANGTVREIHHANIQSLK